MSELLKNKIGFWTFLSIVINAQIGASIFLLPAELARFRAFGLIGWIIGGLGAIMIAMVFAFLCLDTDKPGGPHTYARMFFGEKVGFFVTWIFWCGSWACNPIIIATAVNYLCCAVGDFSPMGKLIAEISIVLSLTAVNVKGVKCGGYLSNILLLLKILPLIVVPLLAFGNMHPEHFAEYTPVGMSPMSTILKSSLIACWAFVGLEEGGSAAHSVTNPKKIVPLGIVLGTSFVAIVSLVITVSVFGVVPLAELEKSGAPFATVLGTLLGGSYDKLIGILTFIMCYGSLNAWVLFSGQIAQSASNEGIFPKHFGKTSANGAPTTALWLACFGTIAILIINEATPFGSTLSEFLDMSVIIYLALYLIAIISYITWMVKNKKYSWWKILITLGAFAFCVLIMSSSSVRSLYALGVLLLISLPVYFNVRKTHPVV